MLQLGDLLHSAVWQVVIELLDSDVQRIDVGPQSIQIPDWTSLYFSKKLLGQRLSLVNVVVTSMNFFSLIRTTSARART